MYKIAIIALCPFGPCQNEGAIIATDKRIASELDIPPRTLADWKKSRVKLYERLVWSYEVEEQLTQIQGKAGDIEEIAKKLLRK